MDNRYLRLEESLKKLKTVFVYEFKKVSIDKLRKFSIDDLKVDLIE